MITLDLKNNTDIEEIIVESMDEFLDAIRSGQIAMVDKTHILSRVDGQVYELNLKP